jgi:hypothetical protein
MKKTIITCTVILFIGSAGLIPAYADTVKLIEESILVGKILNEDPEKIIFANSYGTFKINKIYISEIYRTVDYTEDVNIQKRIKTDVNVDEIKRNVDAGLEKQKILAKRDLEAKKKETPGDLWNSGRISVSGTFFYVFGRVAGKLPYGYSGFISLDQGLDMGLGRRHPMTPGLRFEAGYLFFRKGSLSISGYTGGGGLMWTMPSMKNRGGCFVLAMMPGISYLDIKNGSADKHAKSLTLTAQAIMGYQVSFGVFSMFFHARYIYIYDRNIFFHSIGGELGFGFNAW